LIGEKGVSTSQNTEEKKEKAKSSVKEALQEFAPFMTLGIQLAAAVVVFFFIGDWLDSKFGTSPWLKLLGIFIGTTGGFIQFFRSVSKLEKKQDSTKK
jgi:ATP synthase protein I